MPGTFLVVPEFIGSITTPLTVKTTCVALKTCAEISNGSVPITTFSTSPSFRVTEFDESRRVRYTLPP
ncbi:MAG: hypothetical protein KKD18_02530, partial [Nanoarchaeota archaeon]|nr:hypothetical protein [Nanoarchaeota archaeon]